MTTPAAGLSVRLRHYVTLVIQIVPFLALAVNLSEGNWRRLGLQVAGMVGMLVFLLFFAGIPTKISARDIPGLITFLGIVAVPAVLFVWNLRAGRTPVPAKA